MTRPGLGLAVLVSAIAAGPIGADEGGSASCASRVGDNRPVTVSLEIPHEELLGGVVIRLAYPLGKLHFPGTDYDVPKEVVTHLREGAYGGTRNLGPKGVRQVVALAGELAPGPLFTLHFTACEGAANPTDDELECVVEQAAQPSGHKVQGIRCKAALDGAPVAGTSAS